MQRSLPTGTSGRALALGLTILVIVAVWLGVVMPLIEWHDQRAQALLQTSALERRMEDLTASLPTLKEQAKAMAAGGDGEPALLAGDSDSMASASLQELLQAMFIQAGVQLNSVETVPGEEAGIYRRIRLRVSFNASWPVLTDLLKDIHLATPALLVDELQVQPALHRISTAPGTFDISCAIFAFRSGTIRAAAR
jgi:type II secretory pathway component PulM